MKKTVLLFAFILSFASTAYSQEFFVNADFVTNYMWRGMKSGNASIQPTVGFSTGGFTVYAWGSTELSDENNEVDLTLNYELGNLTFYLNDIYTQNDDISSNYFNYNAHTTGHIFDAGLIYQISEKFPLSAAWYTVVAGNDYKENGKRAWSTYIEMKYPLTVKGIDLELEAGMTPWEGIYSNKLNVTNIALKASKEFRLSDRFSFPIWGQLGTNPYEKTAYFVFGISL